MNTTGSVSRRWLMLAVGVITMLFAGLGFVLISFTKEELLKMNKQLNRIKKPKKKN